ncbi:MAG TPA: hypothetical protein VKZ60_05240 [Chloroflexota bacterium]|nr:hypothetical protein [Chloroflexota bacterium]
MRVYQPILLAAWALGPLAFVNVGFGLALVALLGVFWLRAVRTQGALLLRLGRLAGTERLVDLAAAAVAIGALIEVAAALLATSVTLWGVRVGVGLAVVGLASAGNALRPVELRAAGVVVRGQLVRWAQVTGYAWTRDAPALLELHYTTLAATPRRARVAVPPEARPAAERLLRERVGLSRARAGWR